MLFTSNPFDRLIPAVADGRDLNPLLQDPGMVFHPPMLYMSTPVRNTATDVNVVIDTEIR